MASDWANLPKHLLDSVIERLWSSSVDYLRFSLVCMPWFSVAKDNQSRRRQMVNDHQEPPMLLFFDDKQEAWKLYNVMQKKILNGHLRLPKKRFCGSSKGWLILMEKIFEVTLIKPFFNSRVKEDLVIRLPEINDPTEMEDRDILKELYAEDCDYNYAFKAIITADPILNPNECIVVLIYGERGKIAFIRPGKDTDWTYLSAECFGNDDVFQREEGKFCAVTHCHCKLHTFNISTTFDVDLNCVNCIKIDSPTRMYLVNSDEKDLLMVERECDWEDSVKLINRYTKTFRVFKCSFDQSKWIELESLGEDVALFVGENVAVSVVASNHSGCKRNCIYYNHDYDTMESNDVKINDFGVYDMEKKRISKPYSEEFISVLEVTTQRPIWFTPGFEL